MSLIPHKVKTFLDNTKDIIKAAEGFKALPLLKHGKESLRER